MTGGCRRSAAAAVIGALLLVVMAAASTGVATAAAPVVRAAPAVSVAPSAERVARKPGDRIPCDYTYADTVVVDAPCKGKCGLDRPYRVNRRVKMWAPGTPKTEKPLFVYTTEWLCTPTRKLEGAAQPDGKPLTCLAMLLPAFSDLCPHMPAAPGCGWETVPTLQKKVAQAIKAEVRPPTKERITQCRRLTNI